MVTNACAWIRSLFILDSWLIPCEIPCYSLSILCSSRQHCRWWWLHCGASQVGGLSGTGLFKWHQLDLLLRETRKQHADIKLASKECCNGPSELLLMRKVSRHNGDVYGKDNQPKVGSMPSCSSALLTRGALARTVCVLQLGVFYMVIPEVFARTHLVKWLSLLGSRLLLHLQILQGR